MKYSFKAAICSYLFIFFAGSLFGTDFKPPHLTPYTQDLIDKTRLGTIEDRIRAIDECGVGRFSVCYYVLIELLQDPDITIRERSAFSLGLLRNTSAVPHIEKALNQEKEEIVQASLIRALTFLKIPEASVLASKYLSHNSEKIRYSAAKVLSMNINNDLYNNIMERLKSETSDTIKIILLQGALKIKQTEPEINSLIEYFYSTQRKLRLNSAKAARDLKLKEFLQPLRKAIIIEVDPDVLDEFYQAYRVTYFK